MCRTVRMDICICALLRRCTHLYDYLCISVYMDICKCTYRSMHICILYTCMYVCIHIHIQRCTCAHMYVHMLDWSSSAALYMGLPSYCTCPAFYCAVLVLHCVRLPTGALLQRPEMYWYSYCVGAVLVLLHWHWLSEWCHTSKVLKLYRRVLYLHLARTLNSPRTHPTRAVPLLRNPTLSSSISRFSSSCVGSIGGVW